MINAGEEQVGDCVYHRGARWFGVAHRLVHRVWKSADWLFFAEPSAKLAVPVRCGYGSMLSGQIPQLCTVQGSDRVIRATALAVDPVPLEKPAKIAFRIWPWRQPWITMACPANRPEQRDGLVQGWLVLEPVYLELLDSLHELIDGHVHLL